MGVRHTVHVASHSVLYMYVLFGYFQKSENFDIPDEEFVKRIYSPLQEAITLGQRSRWGL